MAEVAGRDDILQEDFIVAVAALAEVVLAEVALVVSAAEASAAAGLVGAGRLVFFVSKPLRRTLGGLVEGSSLATKVSQNPPRVVEVGVLKRF